MSLESALKENMAELDNLERTHRTERMKLSDQLSEVQCSTHTQYEHEHTHTCTCIKEGGRGGGERERGREGEAERDSMICCPNQ